MGADVQTTIEDVVRKRLSDAMIDDVIVWEDVDHYGDDILRVRVIFDSRKSRLDPQKTLGMVRLVREALAEIGEERFPIFYYVSRAEAKGLTPAAE